MTTEDILKIIAAVGGVFTIIGGFVIQILAARIAKVQDAVNGTHTVNVDKIEELQKEVRILLADKAEKSEKVAEKAQAAVQTVAAPSSPTEVLVVNPPHDPVPTITPKKL